MNNIDKIKNAIELGNQEKSKLVPQVLHLEGMSSSKFRHLINNLVDEETRYLEIGTWKGSVLMSALYGNNPQFYISMDNFSCHGDVERDLLNAFTHIFNKQPNFIRKDSFAINPKEYDIRDINLYFYDGGHEWEQQYNAIDYYYDSLAEKFIFIVDDYDEKFIQDATQKVLKDRGIKIEYEQYLTSRPPDFPPGPYRGEWWCGYYLAACSKG